MQSYILAAATVDCENRADGSYVLENRERLGPYPPTVAVSLLDWAKRAPERIVLADRKDDPRKWRSMTYAALADQSQRLAHSLLDFGLGPEHPVMLISENRIEAAVVQFACFSAAIPVAPVTPAYSSGGGDPLRLATIIELLRPGLIIVDRIQRHIDALERLEWPRTKIVGIEPSGATASFASLLHDAGGRTFTPVEASIDADAVAKILFTSGSTGIPKGAINTHRMLASNAQAIRQGWPFLQFEPPIVADWLPWTHTFGGNYVMNTVIGTGGTLYIDDGRPLPDAIRRSVENNADVKPTLHINAPRGLEMVARILADDEQLARPFFERLGLVMFASAGLPPRVRNHWHKLIDRYATREVRFVSAWGTTETSPLATALNFDAEQVNNIGNPVPGTTIKLAALESRYELRVKGPNVSPGYLNQPNLTQAMFDDEGYFCTGDVGRLANPENPSAGILIEGRLAEDFKLDSGTWVNVSGLRSQLLELLGPVVRDVVLSGANRRVLSALIFIDLEQCQRFSGLVADCLALAAHPKVHSHIRTALEEHNNRNAGSSRRIGNFRVMTRLLEAGAGELTEKGTVNQAVILRREALLCEELDAAATGPG
jgi:feruloyl-CoA synthase